jgi:hypothetical protein
MGAQFVEHGIRQLVAEVIDRQYRKFCCHRRETPQGLSQQGRPTTHGDAERHIGF